MKANLEKEYVACCLCGSEASHGVGSGTDREYPTSPDVFKIVECDGCGLRYLNPRPAQAELATIYPANYHAYNIRSPDSASKKLPPVTRLRHRIYSRRFRRVFELLANRPSIEMLDVGCGDGWMLDLYKMAAPVSIHTHGVDFNPEVCDVARAFGHTVYCSRFEDLQLNGRFDVVNMSHVIEHVSDPLLIAKKCHDVLKPGGILVIETPNTDTLDCKWFVRGNWGAYHIPRHWNLFDTKTLRRLGEQAGFTFHEVVFNPAPVHWVWTFNNMSVARGGTLGRMGQRLFAPLDVFGGGLKAFLFLATFTLFDAALKLATGRTSNMMMIFRKEPK